MKKKIFRKVTVAVTLAVLVAFAVPSFAGNVQMAPTIMPNFPMLAGDNVMIMWVPVPGAVKYKLYQNGKPIGEAPAPPFTSPAPAEPGVYKYTITGVDAGGEEGPASREGVLSIVKLEQPKGFGHRFLGEVLNIRWEAAPNAVIYDVYRSDTKDGEYKLISSVTDTRYVDADIKEDEHEGKSIFYKVVSKDKFNKMSPDTEINEVKIEKRTAEAEKAPDITLKIQRTKMMFIAKPMGNNTDIKSAFDAKFFNDGETMVLTDPFAQRVQLLDKFGDQVGTLGEVGPKPDQMGAPFLFHIDEDDNVYISDTQKDKIFGYTREGALIFHVPAHLVTEPEAKGKYDPPKNYQLVKVSGLAKYDDKLYVAEKISSTIQIYDPNTGEFLGFLKNKETGEIPYFGAPGILLLDRKTGKLYMERPLERKVTVVDLNTGEILFEIGKSKTFIGSFMSVTGMCFDKEGNIIIADPVMRSVQVFSTEDGKYLYSIGDEKAIPDARSKDQRPFISKMEKPSLPNVDSQGRLWIYTAMKGFMVRKYVGDNIWDSTTDKPEGASPK